MLNSKLQNPPPSHRHPHLVWKFSADRIFSAFHPATETPAKTQENAVVPPVVWISKIENTLTPEATIEMASVRRRPSQSVAK